MPRASVVAKNYAKALFDATRKSNALDKVSTELDEFKKNFNSSFAHELQNPVISKSELEKVMEDITQKLALTKITSDFFMAMARNRRLSMFPEIHCEFFHLVKKQKNILEVEVIFATKPTKAQFDQIKSLIEKKHSGKVIEIKETFNAKILGGFQVKIGSSIIDVSLKNQLSNLEKQLSAAF
ncbi:MAG: ATP synthase F1 subunit delta [Proteobacteria bacterium]|nr:ATP synthase F1 subunit delta [Pseudomonadota bacterium]